jgi:hypothetical protein
MQKNIIILIFNNKISSAKNLPKLLDKGRDAPYNAIDSEIH